MKQKIITALKTKYQRFGLSNEAVDRIASAKEKTVTSEDQIEAAIADAETMGLIASELQKSADAERRKASELQKSFDDYKTAHPEQTPPAKTAEQEEEPEWARKLREQNEQIIADQKRRDAVERQRQSETNVKAALEKAGCTNPGILRLTMKGFALGENETEEQAVTRLTADYNQNVKDAFGDGNIPPIGAGVPTADPHQVAEKMNAILEQNGLLPPKE